jgi:hypothetical protein
VDPKTKGIALLVSLLCACSGSGSTGDDDTITGNGSVFEPSITAVQLEVDYETGDEPYTGNVIGFGDTWDLTTTNLDRLFANRKALDVPTTIDQMEDIGAVPDEEITVDDALAIADAHRDLSDDPETKTYYIVFVSGHFADSGGVNDAVLGVSIGDTGVVVMFKDVIEGTGLVARYVEQSTLVHELGHAIGLVDNGVPMVADHKDSAHGAHCTNDHCVMYWENEGASAAAAFAQQFATSGNSILFADDCLADVDAVNGSQ